MLLIDPRKNWTPHDLFELFVHEVTHQLVFLDEYRYQHYKSREELSPQENYAISAVLKIPRPIDKVLHSLVVNYEILAFRCSLDYSIHSNVHPKSDEMLKQVSITVDSVRKVNSDKNLLLPRALQLLDMIEVGSKKMKINEKNKIECLSH